MTILKSKIRDQTIFLNKQISSLNNYYFCTNFNYAALKSERNERSNNCSFIESGEKPNQSRKKQKIAAKFKSREIEPFPKPNVANESVLTQFFALKKFIVSENKNHNSSQESKKRKSYMAGLRNFKDFFEHKFKFNKFISSERFL